MQTEADPFLLEVLSDFQVSIPELGTIQAKHHPTVFLTSNNTRELSEALKRRCLYIYIGYPDIQEELQISVGNTNMNLRALMDWGLVYKELIPGERKEHFRAEKDIWEVVRKIITQRKRKELEPVLKALDDVSDVQGNSDEVAEFLKVVQDIRLFSSKADNLLETLLKSDSEWFVKSFLKMVK